MKLVKDRTTHDLHFFNMTCPILIVICFFHIMREITVLFYLRLYRHIITGGLSMVLFIVGRIDQQFHE